MMRPMRASPANREPLEHERLAHMRLGNDEIVDVQFVIVLRIRDRRLEALAHVLGDSLARKFQIRERRRDLLAADQARDEIEFLRAHPEHPGHRLSLVLGEAALVRFLAHRSRSSKLSSTQRALPAQHRRRRCARTHAWLYDPTSGRRRCGSARTRRTCGRPFPRSPAPECACGRCRRRTVSPTNCGRIVERRLQIRIISWRLDPRAASAFFSR